MDDRSDPINADKVETRDRKPAPAANEDEAIQGSEPAPKDEMQDKKDEKKRHSRLAMSHREAETIAQNLKESGTRR
jgi:hypothetical protein